MLEHLTIMYALRCTCFCLRSAGGLREGARFPVVTFLVSQPCLFSRREEGLASLPRSYWSLRGCPPTGTPVHS